MKYIYKNQSKTVPKPFEKLCGNGLMRYSFENKIAKIVETRI